jgi:dihydrofolate synthase/folylpolyglutamate synthase
MGPQDADRYLNSFINYESHLHTVLPHEFKLQRVRQVLEYLGNPDHQFPTIQVAGTKGKGSVSAFIAHILRCMGKKVGLYTSPHLQDVRERIRILIPSAKPQTVSLLGDGRRDIFPDCISPLEWQALLDSRRAVLEKFRHSEYGKLSYFEVLTILALDHFAEKRVDMVVLETGIGGRLDATNVVNSVACAITPISLEHTRLLGDRVEQIAAEKAAIIKNPRQKVVIAPQILEAMSVIQERCGTLGISPRVVGKDILFAMKQSSLMGNIVIVQGIRRYQLQTKLIGPHQAENVAVAVGVIESLVEDTRDIVGMVEAGAAETFWPCRFEVMAKEPLLIIDGAHTPHACQRLAETVSSVLSKRYVVGIVGVSEDKDRAGICGALSPICDEVIATCYGHDRAYRGQLADWQKLFPGKPCRMTDTVRQALALVGRSKDVVVLVTGSLYLAAEIREVWGQWSQEECVDVSI